MARLWGEFLLEEDLEKELQEKIRQWWPDMPQASENL